MTRVVRAAEHTTIALIPVVVLQRVARDAIAPAADLITRFARNKIPDISADVPATQVVEAPVSLHRGEVRVVVVEVVVDGALKQFGDGGPQHDGGDFLAG